MHGTVDEGFEKAGVSVLPRKPPRVNLVRHCSSARAAKLSPSNGTRSVPLALETLRTW